MGKLIRFEVRRVNGEWVVRREGALWDAWLEEPLKAAAIQRAFQLAQAFQPSVVLIHHEDRPLTRREFPTDDDALSVSSTVH